MTQAVALAQQASTGVSQGFKNRIINGAMVIDQRNAGASFTVPSGGGYTVDRWQCVASQASKFTAQQNSGNAPTTQGFSQCLKLTSSSSYSLGAGDYFQLQQSIEGFNTADLGFGTSAPKTVTLSFWVNASITGTYGMFFINNSASRIYPTFYTVNSANTWEYKTITLTGDTTGTWETASSTGIRVAWVLGYGSTYTGATSNAWASLSSAYVQNGCVNFVGTSGATFYITGVQLEVGSTATSFDTRPYGTELQLCYRYFIKTNPTGAAGSGGLGGSYYGTTDAAVSYNFPVTMRAAPTVVRTSAGGNGDTFWVSGVTASSAGTSANVTTGTTGMWQEVNGMSTSVKGQPAFYNGSLQLSSEL